MIFLVKLALKNIGRNPRRTLLTSFGIVIAVGAVIFGKAFMDGSNEPMIEAVADMQTGHIRIVQHGYTQKERVLPVNLFFNYKDINEKTAELTNLDESKPRIRFKAALSFNDSDAEGILVNGIDPERESKNVILKGILPEKGKIVVSSALAEKLGIKKGDSLIILAQTAYGYLNGTVLQADTFFETGINYIANSFVYINIEDAQKVLSIPKDCCTELLLYCKNPYTSFPLFLKVRRIVSEMEGMDVVFWETSGSLIQALRVRMIVVYLIGLIIFFLASIAIVNTMIVALLERTKEIGMMKALGMSSGKIFVIFFTEALVIGAIGALIGSGAGYIVTSYFAVHGLDYSQSLNNIKFPINPVIYPRLGFGTILVSFSLGLISSLISSLFLIKRIALLNPIDILRE